ncbi:MAG: peptide chain release factor N(5)-glutamine methyltransferase [Synechococcaceae cyanobacterium ELA445]|jgi:release factor glutamine methyltransferase
MDRSPVPTSTVQVRGAALLLWRRRLLGFGGRPAELDWLLDLAGGLRWRDLQRLRLEPERVLSLQRPLAELENLWKRHLATATPLQYLVGLCPWRDLDLSVAPGVLIPRQETELLVDLALERVSTLGRESLSWADLGTGSGCLAVALAVALPPGSRGFAVDCSAGALAQARGNLERAGRASAVDLLQGHWWDPLASFWGQLDLVVSNPPYIPSELVGQLDPVVRDHEPLLALDGGTDGLASLRLITAGAFAALAPGGWLLLEHHHDQGPAVRNLLAEAGLVEVATVVDLEGHDRFSLGSRPAFPGAATVPSSPAQPGE